MTDLDRAVERLTSALAASDELGMPEVACDRETARLILSALRQRGERDSLLRQAADLLALITTPYRFGEKTTGQVFLDAISLERKARTSLSPIETGKADD